MAEPIAGPTIEARRIVLRDDSGRVRGQWSADFGHTSLVLFGADEKPRISMTVEESEHSNFRDTFLAQTVFYGEGGKPTIHLEGFNDSGRLSLLDRQGKIRASLALQHFEHQDWPQLILSGADGWRMMLIVHNEIPHIILYDNEDNPRIQMLVDKRGTPHVRRYWWKRFTPHWKWVGYYPCEGVEG